MIRHGVAGAKSNLAELLYHGQRGLKKNVGAAYDYFVGALGEDKDSAELQYNIGIMELKGEGTTKNVKSALLSLQKAAEKKNAAALVGLGYYYMTEGNEIETAIG